MISQKHARLGFLVIAGIGIAVAACGTIAELDVEYRSIEATADGGGTIDPTSTDAGRIIRDSSFDAVAAEEVVLEPSDAGPCDPSTDPDGGCDFTQGLGCCIRAGGESECIYQSEIADKCKNSVFVGCRADDPTSESACCWRLGPANTRMSVFASSCDGGTHACLPDDGGGCADNTKCNTVDCTIGAGTFTIGTCGAAAEVCP